MNTTQIKERLEKAIAEVEKRHGTIEKKIALAEKKKALVNKKFGIDIDSFNPWQETDAFDKETLFDIRMEKMDIERYYDDVESIKEKIKEKEKTIENYKAQLCKAEEIDRVLTLEIPESMLLMKEQLVAEWDKWDKERRENLKARYKEMGYKEFMKRYSYADYEFRNKSDEDLHKSNEREAKAEVLDLYNRVKDITGEVKDWSYIRLTSGNSFPVLNGYVEGVNGRANVESILAGGYNIQRLHVRTLVHRV